MENTLIISEPAQKRISEILESKGKGSFLRVLIQSGGCAGFQSSFKVENKTEEDDIIIKQSYNNKDVVVVIDSTSLELVKNSTIEFTNSIMGSYFWLNVPNAASSCGCGSSFSL